MSRPTTQDEYLASLVPASVRGVSRRVLLRGALGAGTLLATPTLLSACGGDSGTAAGGKATGTVTLGSNQSDAVPKAAIQSVMDAFEKANSGLTVKINTIDHNSFQENINNYLQGSPDDVFMWFAGYRMRFFASKGLAGDVSEAWKNIQGMTDALKKSSTGDDGKQYFVPSTYYPWALFYRRSVFDQYGYEVPKTLDELTALGAQMKKDGLVPIAFGDKDGWPAMGTFDQLNLRINGYDFHVSLMAGEEAWNSDKVKKVFDTWAGLLPLHQPDSLGRTWQEAAQTLQQKKAGTYLLGAFVAQQFEKGAEQDDLDFFNFPEIDPAIGSDAIEAPIDGYMMSKRPKNEAGAFKLLTYVGSAEAQNIVVKADPSVIATNEQADQSGYTALQKKSVEFVKSAKSIAQFMDRDTRPDFASTVMIPAIQQFIKNPKDIDGLVNSIEKQKQSIFAS
jgi:multiple sugar transport system substrate-binding protein